MTYNKMCVGWCQISCECKGFLIMLGTSLKPHVARYPLIANAHKAHHFRPLQPTVAWSINTEQSKSNRKGETNGKE